VKKIKLHDKDKILAKQDECVAAAITDILINSSGPGDTNVTLLLPNSNGASKTAIQPN
jgi:hypothetical protein